ncbi:hypothetical protein ACLB2K_064729 [Fragaria x ananassa]
MWGIWFGLWRRKRSWGSVFSCIFWGTQMEFNVRILMGGGFVMHVIVGLLWNALKVMTWDSHISCIFWEENRQFLTVLSNFWIGNGSQNLFQAVGGRWEDIEPDDYKIVVETYFELNRKGDDEHIDQKPRKRRHLADEEDQASPGSSELSLRHSSGNGNDRPTYHLASGDGSVHRERASASAVPCSDHMNYFKKPKDKVSTDDATFSAERTSVRRPGSVNGGARIQRPITREDKKPPKYISDITKSTEKVAISLIDEVGSESLPRRLSFIAITVCMCS